MQQVWNRRAYCYENETESETPDDADTVSSFYCGEDPLTAFGYITAANDNLEFTERTFTAAFPFEEALLASTSMGRPQKDMSPNHITMGDDTGATAREHKPNSESAADVPLHRIGAELGRPHSPVNDLMLQEGEEEEPREEDHEEYLSESDNEEQPPIRVGNYCSKCEAAINANNISAWCDCSNEMCGECTTVLKWITALKDCRPLQGPSILSRVYCEVTNCFCIQCGQADFRCSHPQCDQRLEVHVPRGTSTGFICADTGCLARMCQRHAHFIPSSRTMSSCVCELHRNPDLDDSEGEDQQEREIDIPAPEIPHPMLIRGADGPPLRRGSILTNMATVSQVIDKILGHIRRVWLRPEPQHAFLTAQGRILNPHRTLAQEGVRPRDTVSLLTYADLSGIQALRGLSNDDNEAHSLPADGDGGQLPPNPRQGRPRRIPLPLPRTVRNPDVPGTAPQNTVLISRLQYQRLTSLVEDQVAEIVTAGLGHNVPVGLRAALGVGLRATLEGFWAESQSSVQAAPDTMSASSNESTSLEPNSDHDSANPDDWPAPQTRDPPASAANQRQGELSLEEELFGPEMVAEAHSHAPSAAPDEPSSPTTASPSSDEGSNIGVVPMEIP